MIEKIKCWQDVVVYNEETDSGEILNLRRRKEGDKFVCPCIGPDGNACNRLVKRLFRHISLGHGEKGTFFHLPKTGKYCD
jgi:hypothetical protein